MKWTKWTPELIREIASKCPNVRHFHHYHRGAEKAAKRFGILEDLFPDKESHSSAYTEEQIAQESQKYTKRSQFQLGAPSIYNAAKRLNLLSALFPIQLNKRYTDEELIEAALRYGSIKEWDEKDNGSYQVASRRGIVASHGPKPIQGTSTAEIELLNFLKTLNTDFQTKRFKNDYELDCYSESLNIGVEYNGLYWHSEEHKPRMYHVRKTKYFESLGIRVVHVWEHEWESRKTQVKDFLTSACKANKVRIGARKCKFLEIDGKTARAFLDDTHIQGGPVHVKYALGCYYNDLLVGVCTFGTHHRNNHTVVLNRFACLPNYSVSGFLSKASKLAYQKLGPMQSWADYSKSQGVGYIAAGWVIDRILPPDYFYIDSKSNVIAKQSRKKSSVGTPKEMTELEHATLDGLKRVWDCGKISLIYSVPTPDLNNKA